MRKLIAVCTVLLVAAIFCGCGKSGTKPSIKVSSNLPSPTQTGSNVMAWTTDSVPFITTNNPLVTTLYIDTIKTDSYYNTGHFIIQSSSAANNGVFQSVEISSPVRPINYPIVAGTVYPIEAHTLNNFNEALPNSYFIHDAYNGQITISRYDPAKRILSGSFSFTSDPSNKIRKVNGWFDIQYQ
jgi:hypothetical protein